MATDFEMQIISSGGMENQGCEIWGDVDSSKSILHPHLKMTKCRQFYYGSLGGRLTPTI